MVFVHVVMPIVHPQWFTPRHIAVFPDHGTSSTALLRRADEALYTANRGGRDGWRIASLEAAGSAGARPA